ncbi:MAG: winged helix-turn-helix domain-containing protein, partial [Pseudomonadota bacterium]
MIPDYQSIMLPLLRHVSDKGEYKFRDIIEGLANKFGLTDEERKELLPSGIQPIFQNRVGWAKTYLKKAGLIDTPKRATVTITTRGLEILEKNLDSINVKFLKQFPEFVEFQTAKRVDGETETETAEEQSTQTPEETLETAYQKIRKSLAQDLINRVMALSPAFFERLVVELLVKMGYG